MVQQAEDHTTVVTVWSDLHCPWATVAIHRLRAARDRHDLPVVFDQRPWPLEWVNEQGAPRQIVEPESHVLADHEPDLFSAYRATTWPSTFLPAFELVAAARRALGLRAAEDIDYALRLRFFRAGADVSLRHELQRAAQDSGHDAEAIMRAWRYEPVRGDVVNDYESSAELPIQGSPQIFWPDGSTDHNPGMTAHDWVRGLPRLDADALDPQACEQLLLHHVG
ncbi:MAG: DsbA family oxidoreductase [Egibacteraceae bacterium]